MTILLTGCAGFIGSRVSHALIQAGHRVLGVDNLNDAYDIRLKLWRLDALRDDAGFHFRETDVSDPAALDDVVRHERLEAVVNLAARAGVRQSLSDPQSYIDTNVTGTLNLLELCRRTGTRKFVLASTSSLYGLGERPFRESQPTDRPLSPYAASKKAAESLCYTYHALFDIDVSVLRYFTVYGPAGRPEMSIFRFIRWIAEGEPLVLYGDGRQERDFTYVDDVAEGTVRALRPVGYEIVNLGSDRPVSLLTVIALLEGLLGRRARIERRAPHPTDVPATWADIGKARRLLEWQPRTSLEAGLRAAAQWYTTNRTWARGLVLDKGATKGPTRGAPATALSAAGGAN